VGHVERKQDALSKKGAKMKHVLKSLVALFFLIAITRLSFSAPKNPSDDIKVVHGRDGRIDTFHLAGTVWEELSRSVAMQIKNSDMISNDEVSTKLLGLSLSKSLEPALCADEQFATQIKVGSCSGFLVSDSHIVTAGHCLLSQADCDNKSWVFDYELKYAEDLDYTVVPSRNIFKCKKIISQHADSNTFTDRLDFALIQLDHSVINRRPLTVRLEGKIENNAPLAVIGHPDGIPKKFADGAKVMENDDEVFFSTNLDTFHVNSGSPVFNFETGVVEGILVRGALDYVFDAASNCSRVNTIFNGCKDKSCALEDVTRISQVEKLKEILSSY